MRKNLKSSTLDVSEIKSGKSLDDVAEITMKNIEILKAAYPEDIPNQLCNTALLSGVFYHDERTLEVGYFNRLFSTIYEDVYVWKTESNYAHFVCVVDSKVKDLDVWKTSGLLISLSFAWNKGFEHSTDGISYNWVYRFDEKQAIADLDFYDANSLDEVNNGFFVTNQDLKNMIRLMALLTKDDSFLKALINFVSSMQLNYTCLFCELSTGSYKMHPSHEPKVWEKLSLYNNFETAIVLACKSVENILGKPPKRENFNSVVKFKNKWASLLNINPEDQFDKGKCSYFDFYYQLFNLRNSSAHADVKKSFDLKRKNTIESQCFAAVLIFDYIDSNLPSYDESCIMLKLNKELIR